VQGALLISGDAVHYSWEKEFFSVKIDRLPGLLLHGDHVFLGHQGRLLLAGEEQGERIPALLLPSLFFAIHDVFLEIILTL
jgi:hypothetical protein